MPVSSSSASRRDFAAAHGLKLDFVQLKNDAIALKALLAGDLDSYEGGSGGAIIAASHGADVKVVGCPWLVPPHGVYVRDNIATMADLKGKSVAVSAPGSFPEIFARAAFEKAGVPVSAVKFAAMGSDSDRYRALMAGVVDAAIITNEFVPLAGKQPIKDIMPAREVVPDVIRVCVHMTGKTLRDRREDAVRFVAAEIEGLRFAMSHRDDDHQAHPRHHRHQGRRSAAGLCVRRGGEDEVDRDRDADPARQARLHAEAAGGRGKPRRSRSTSRRWSTRRAREQALGLLAK